ncbi:aspartyl/asparaginyl beta-hydroxylase domain-containing protein [Bacillus sp. 17RED48]|uniref:aspartyl/asparaginyl beta-hydroxylase domain-containing protein n=1 Tax=Bacillus sp. 17RED48 TaxID=2778093 RepID=UPI001C9AADFB|nr:aspartyl/asparaginyl beta-hydroxylase domain-containing protein [Bacillus sp. 17RED48]MBY7115258.1 aspartyl/asparaginyl beta-hydroxylase domain-containing protein [Bacillus sp. 17RED48]
MASYIIGKIDLNEELLNKDLQTIANSPVIPEEYDEFSTGYWMNNSLWNASNDKADTMYRDFDHAAQQIEYGKQLPYINQILEDYFAFDNLKMVRTRNLIDAMVIPHRDFVEFKDNTKRRFRVFLALEDNTKAFHSDEEAVFRIRKGEIWFLDAAIGHAAANFSKDSRVFLCLDYVFNEDFLPSDIFKDKETYNPDLDRFIVQREKLDSNFEKELISSLSKVMTRITFRDIVFFLSKIHFEKDIPVAQCYDWLDEIAEKSGDQAIVNKAKHLREYIIEHRNLGERFSMDNWKEEVTV